MAQGFDQNILPDLDRMAEEDVDVFPQCEAYRRAEEGSLLAIVWGIRRDLADIRLDLVGERGEPHGPRWSGNFDERLWALTQSAAVLGPIRTLLWVQTILLGLVLYRVW